MSHETSEDAIELIYVVYLLQSMQSTLQSGLFPSETPLE